MSPPISGLIVIEELKRSNESPRLRDYLLSLSLNHSAGPRSDVSSASTGLNRRFEADLHHVGNEVVQAGQAAPLHGML
jgi:hypothetical protein